MDLNCDLGEFDEPDRLALDERIVPLVTSVSVACGFHAGNQNLMRRTIRLACANGVAVGAHPGFPDREEFGRHERTLTTGEIESLVAYQVGALAGIAALEGARLSHVKPHGALYNMGARDRSLAGAIAHAVALVDRRLILFGLAGSALIEAGRAAGLTVAEEVFVDRAYAADGSLVPRHRDGAVLRNDQEVIRRVRRLLLEGCVESDAGQPIRIHADTMCLHSDTPGSVRLAELVRRELTALDACVEPVRHAKL